MSSPITKLAGADTEISLTVITGKRSENEPTRPTAEYTQTRRCGSVYFGVVILSMCEVFYVY